MPYWRSLLLYLDFGAVSGRFLVQLLLLLWTGRSVFSAELLWPPEGLVQQLSQALGLAQRALLVPTSDGWFTDEASAVYIIKRLSKEAVSSVTKVMGNENITLQKTELCMLLPGHGHFEFSEQMGSSHCGALLVQRWRGARKPTSGRLLTLTLGGQLLEVRGPSASTWVPLGALSSSGRLWLLPRPRDDLQAMAIASVTKTHEPFTFRDIKEQKIHYSGFLFEVIGILQNKMNFTVDVHEVADGEWGKQQPSGKWSGVVGELADGKAKLAVCSLIITTDRLDVIRFSTPVYKTRESLFVRWPDPEGASLRASVRRLGAVFEPAAWAAAGAALAASSLCLCLLGRPRDAALRAVAALCSQGGDVGGGAGRRVLLAVVATHACGTCLLAAYSGRLTALRAVRRASPPFRGLQGLLQNPHYSLALIRGSRLDALFSVSHDPTLRALRRDHMVDDHPLEYLEGFQRVCREPGFALLATRRVHGAMAGRLPCRLMEVPDAYFDGLAAFAYSKDFQHSAGFNYWLLRLKANGVLRRLEPKTKRRFYDDSGGGGDSQGAGVETLVVAAAAPCALLLLVAERRNHAARRQHLSRAPPRPRHRRWRQWRTATNQRV